ncbi:tetratricopeptide repeat protein [Gilliamella sp. BG2]|uniref:tetratricopeptide repeat protein n=1 Tax=Gilliamella sp. BG2 TaxID=3351509 RepID=UPI003985B637
MSSQQLIDIAIKQKELFFIGESLPRDWYEGFILWEKIAKTGEPKALFNMAYCYYTGEGTEKNIEKAIEYYEKSADKGLSDAYYYIYKMLKNTDPKRALTFLEKGVINGSELSQQHIKDARLNYEYNEKIKIYNKYYVSVMEGIEEKNPPKIRNEIAKAKQDGVDNLFQDIELGIRLQCEIIYQKGTIRHTKGEYYHSSDNSFSYSYDYERYYKYKVKLYNPTDKTIFYNYLNEEGFITSKEKKQICGIVSDAYEANLKEISIPYTNYAFSDNKPRQCYFVLPNIYVTKKLLPVGMWWRIIFMLVMIAVIINLIRSIKFF